eukprot:1182922-Prorocentrum_minimum.AAC.1
MATDGRMPLSRLVTCRRCQVATRARSEAYYLGWGLGTCCGFKGPVQPHRIPLDRPMTAFSGVRSS